MGFSFNMIASYKNNGRPKMDAFSAWRKFEKEYQGDGHQKKEVDPAILRQIRASIQRDKRKRLIRSILLVPVSVIVLFLIITLIWMVKKI